MPARRDAHLLDLQTRYLHATNNIWKQSHHIIIAHGHVGNDLLQRNLLRRMILVLLPSTVQLQPQLRYFALWGTPIW